MLNLKYKKAKKNYGRRQEAYIMAKYFSDATKQDKL